MQNALFVESQVAKKGNKQMGVRVVVNTIGSNDNHALKNKVLKIQSRFQVEDGCTNSEENRVVVVGVFCLLVSVRKLSLNFEKYHQNELLQSDTSIEFHQFEFVHGIQVAEKTDYAFDVNFITKSHV